MNWYLCGTLELITTLVSTWYKTTGSCVWRQRAKGLRKPIGPSQDFWLEGSQGKLHHSTHGLLMPCRRGRGQHKVGERILSFRNYRRLPLLLMSMPVSFLTPPEYHFLWLILFFRKADLSQININQHRSLFSIAFWVPLVFATGRIDSLLAFDKKLHKQSLFCSAALH